MIHYNILERSTELLAVSALLVGAMIGCAKTTVDGNVQTYDGVLSRPEMVIVHEFAYEPDKVSPSSAVGVVLYDLAEGETLDEKQRALGDAVAKELAAELVRGLAALGLNAQLASEADLPESGNVMEIEGQFIKIVEGNRLRRVVIGLGLGVSSLDTQVQIYDGSAMGRVMAMNFSTSSRSSLKPGVAETAVIGPIAAGASAATNVAVSGNETAVADARRTANLIVARITVMARQQGWIEK